MCIRAKKFSDTVQAPSTILFIVRSSVPGAALAYHRCSRKICCINEWCLTQSALHKYLEKNKNLRHIANTCMYDLCLSPSHVPHFPPHNKRYFPFFQSIFIKGLIYTSDIMI